MVVAIGRGTTLRREDIYDAIVSSYKNKYSWLGEQFAEEFLLTACSWSIQEFSKPEFRVRRHLALNWEAAWLKSSLLTKAWKWLGPACTILSDVTVASLRGTVEGREFISPFTLKAPFSVCTEFGQLSAAGMNTELIQKLLIILEEGTLNVSLGKIAMLDEVKREAIEADYGIKFLDNNTFTYNTNWVLMAGTYNSKFLADSALESRFVIMKPKQELNSTLTKYINDSEPYHMDEDVQFHFRAELMREQPIETRIKIPESLFSEFRIITPRELAGLQSYVMCRAWWGIGTLSDHLYMKLTEMKKNSADTWKSDDEKVFEAIEVFPKTILDIAASTGLRKREVYASLKRINASRYWDEEEGIKKWYL